MSQAPETVVVATIVIRRLLCDGEFVDELCTADIDGSPLDEVQAIGMVERAKLAMFFEGGDE